MARNKDASEPKTGVAGWNESVGISSRSSASGSRHGKVVADRKRRIAFLVLLLILCIASVVCFWPLKDRITRGLWLHEGTEVTMAAQAEDGSKPSAGDLSSAVSTISSRLLSANISEYAVKQGGEDSILADFPTSVDAKALAQIACGRGKVELVLVDDIGDADALIKMNAGTKNVAMKEGTYSPFIDGSAIASADVVQSSGMSMLQVTLNDEGKEKLATASKDLAKDMGGIALVIDGQVVSLATVTEENTEGKLLFTSSMSAQEANAAKAVIKGSPLPIKLTYSKDEKCGALVGKTTLWGMVGATIGLLVVLAVASFVKYRKLSLVLSGGMVVYTVLMFGLMALASRVNMFTLTIAGVVGGLCATLATCACLWLITTGFRNRVLDGKSTKGAATSVPREALRPVAAPIAIISVACIVFLFLPMPYLRDFGLLWIYGLICGICAVGWYGITLLRLVAMGAVQADPAAWGVAQADSKTELSAEDTKS